MGCASSKQRRCRHCKGPNSPVPRSYSMHVHHPPQRRGDSYHVVALTSSTIGSLKLQISNQASGKVEDRDCDEIAKIGDFGDILDGDRIDGEKVHGKEQLAMGIIEAKAWSTMIDQKIPKIVPLTPIRTPPGEPETINAWELMEGLEDAGGASPYHYRSFSFNLPRSPERFDDLPKSSFQQPGTGEVGKPLWLQMAADDAAGDGEANFSSGVSEFDPEIIASFRKSLEKLTPAASPAPEFEKAEKVVLYFTSLRGVRKTYEDCCHVRMILKGIGVRVDERDVSMHSGFKEELRELMGEEFGRGGLPRVFVGERYIGGEEEIRRLHEDGQLEKLLDCCEKVDEDGACGGGVCEGCGDVRFVPCEACSGSCKIYYDIDDEEEEEEEEEHRLKGEEEEGEAEEYGFQRCPDCNENGLVRCPLCCY